MTGSPLAGCTASCPVCTASVPIGDLSRTADVYACGDPFACAFRARLRTDPAIWDGLRALSIWQPWAFAVALGKSAENRGRNITFRGAIAIHASLRVDSLNPLAGHTGTPDSRLRISDQFLALGGCDALWDAREQPEPAGHPLMARGAVIAVAELFGAHCYGDPGRGCAGAGRACSPWAVAQVGVWHWQLRGVVPLRQPIATRGNQIPRWKLPNDVTAAIRGQLEAARP